MAALVCAKLWPSLDKLTVSSVGVAAELDFEPELVAAGLGFGAVGLPTLFTAWVSIVFTSKLLKVKR
ncbi:MAG: hypothetical protein VW455_02625 [Nitrospinota bacterium]